MLTLAGESHAMAHVEAVRDRASAEAIDERLASTRFAAGVGDSAPSALRVVIVTARFVPLIGGTELHTQELAARLAGRGHDVTVLTTDPRNELTQNEWLDGVRIRRVRAWPSDRDYYVAPGIYSEVTRGSWDVVHCQGYHTFVAPLAMLAARRIGAPYIVAFHSGGHSSRLRRAMRGPQRRALRPLLAGAQRLVGGTTFETDFFRRALRLPAQLFATIPVGANLPPSGEPDAAIEGDPLLVSVGRLERYKGHHRAIAALPLVLEHAPGAHLRIVGDGPYRSHLLAVAAEHGVSDRVEIKSIPPTDRAGMARLLRRAALVVSLSDYESAGMAVQEALELRRPTLVTRTSAFAEFDDCDGLSQVPLNSHRVEIAAEMIAMLKRSVTGNVTSFRSWDDCVADYLELYRLAIRAARCAC